MPVTYTEPDGESVKLMIRVMKQHHSRLAQIGVTVLVQMANSKDGPPLKRNGYPCAALIKVVSLKDRAAGLADARLLIDSEQWEEMSPADQAALLDHELTHLEPMMKGGQVKRDDLGRPRLRLRVHDFELGGFFEVAQRQKEAAPESQVLGLIVGKYRQMELAFPWG